MIFGVIKNVNMKKEKKKKANLTSKKFASFLLIPWDFFLLVKQFVLILLFLHKRIIHESKMNFLSVNPEIIWTYNINQGILSGKFHICWYFFN